MSPRKRPGRPPIGATPDGTTSMARRADRLGQAALVHGGAVAATAITELRRMTASPFAREAAEKWISRLEARG